MLNLIVYYFLSHLTEWKGTFCTATTHLYKRKLCRTSQNLRRGMCWWKRMKRLPIYTWNYRTLSRFCKLHCRTEMSGCTSLRGHTKCISLLISLVPPMQGTNVYALASSNELGSRSSCNQAMNMEETTLENAHPTPICKLCCDSDACMQILPCQHLCACKSCVANLNMCPMCDLAKPTWLRLDLAEK